MKTIIIERSSFVRKSGSTILAVINAAKKIQVELFQLNKIDPKTEKRVWGFRYVNGTRGDKLELGQTIVIDGVECVVRGRGRMQGIEIVPVAKKPARKAAAKKATTEKPKAEPAPEVPEAAPGDLDELI